MTMIAIGSDHGGFELKEIIKKHLEKRNIEYKDFGTFSEASVDYPAYGIAVGEAVASGECEKGILVCGTGIGISMAANKVKGVRAACCSDTFSARFTRMHNDANVICMGGRVVGPGLALDIVDLFLDTEFEGGRHQKRIDLITEYENK
ncbi:MAG: ribose 5-phosphate isomerase B [Clostridia bacterium]|nr:ribose 5-phosphate isomerase B [Clostridia bacterium]MBR2327319.1 ribose 5-phosphate isomerase B [Clostridia bacterium]